MTVRAFIFLVPCLIVLGTSREAEAQDGHAAPQSVLDAVSRLQGDDLAHPATLARQAEESLAGGASTMLGAWTIYILGLAIVPLVLLIVVLL